MTKRLMLMAALAGCTGSTNYWNPYTPVHAQTTQTRETAIQKAVIAITDAGREIESSDATTGIVISKWWSGDGFGGDQNRFRIRVTFADAAYEIVALCQSKDTMTKAWGDEGCEQNKRPQFVLDVLKRVDVALRSQ